MEQKQTELTAGQQVAMFEAIHGSAPPACREKFLWTSFGSGDGVSNYKNGVVE